MSYGERVRLQEHVRDVIRACDGVRNAAFVTKVDAGYLSRLASGEKDNPSDETLAKLGLSRKVIYVRVTAPKELPHDQD